MTLYVLALLIGIVAGLRAMTAPAMVSWATHLGWLDLGGTWFDFLSNTWVRWLLTLLALVELVTDQLPSTPSRTVPIQFGTRIITGALAGGAIGSSAGSMIGGIVAGVAAQLLALWVEVQCARGWQRPLGVIAPRQSLKT